MHILIRIHRILESRDPALPSLCYTMHGTTKFDFLTLLDFVERSSNLLDHTIHHSPSAAEGNMFFKGFCADVRERVRLANIHLAVPPGTSGDAGSEDIGPILDAMRRAMNASPEIDRPQGKAIDRAARSSDPPPLLCEEAEKNGHDYSSVSIRQGQMSPAVNLEITDTSGNTGVEDKAGSKYSEKFMLCLSYLLGCILGLHSGIRQGFRLHCQIFIVAFRVAIRRLTQWSPCRRIFLSVTKINSLALIGI
ncbi:hypothetical protein V1520DRAFT_66293 [Lipomyces starkeyi]|uniref:Uncharacterized protein n=1 Tax=Lipomyces starkeyi NRRL Y-11557 TaxID=675824 RepID=A0A1E3PXL2_LIPST|nr:hypothetical protein LIPSTDRAFT_74995 [Lipomyces starkeyi NRRL Y-11557]